MANTNSDIYAGQIASPTTVVDSGLLGGRARPVIGTATIADGDFDANGDTITLCSLPASARIISIKISNDDLGDASEDVDIGLYTHQGAVIDANEFADNVTAFQAQVETLTEYLGSGLTVTALQIEKKLWERAGATADTGVLYDIVLTQTGTIAADIAGSIAFVIEYTVA